jgi:OMF family outer membrane factor
MKILNKYKILLLLLFAIGFQTVQAQEWTLENCVDKALANNKLLKIDENNINISKEKQKEVKSNLLPKISAAIDYKYFIDQPTQLMPANAFNPMAPEWQFTAAQFGVPHNINANIQFGMPIYNAKLLNGMETTKIATELRELQFQKSKEDVVLTISNLYYSAQVIRNQIDFMDKNIVNSTKLLDNLKLLKEQKLATGTDVSKIDLQVKQLETSKQLLISKYEQVLNGLRLNMGITNAKFDVVSKVNYKELNSYSPKTITDVKLAETKKKLTDSEIKSLKKEMIPSVMLYGSYGQTGYGYDEKPNEFLDWYPTSFVGLKIDIPVWDFTRKHKIKQKKLENDTVDLQIGLLNDKNTIEIDNTKLQIGVAQATIGNTQEQIAIAQKIYDSVLLQQKQEVASLTDVLMADNNLRQAQQSYLTAVIDYLKADLTLKQLTGNILN